MADSTLLSPASNYAAPSELDASSLDSNIRAVRAVERTWALPSLPDSTKLDLAAQPGVSPDALSAFLHGTAADLKAIDDDNPQATDQKPGYYENLDGFDQSKIILAGISGSPAPNVDTPDAVRLIKRRAAEEGYIQPDQKLADNNVWYPELNGIRGDMAFDDYNKRQRGDRPGAMPLGTAMELLNDFTSPTGLLAAATNLDLFWDFGAINKEFSTWGDKFRKLGKSKNPLDFGKNLVDALTGPIDDIVIPVINVGLLFTGMGEVENAARIAWMGKGALESRGAMEGLYQGFRSLIPGLKAGEGLSAASTARNIEALGEASWLSNRLQKGGAVASKLGEGMAAWRDATAVKGVKSVIQPAMRLGFAQQIESRLPTYQSDGLSIGDVPVVNQAASALDEFRMDPRSMPIEMLLAPYNIFKPGTFFKAGGDGANIVSRTVSGAGAALGTVPGRAAVGGVFGTLGGVIVGDDAGDIAKGAAIGAGAAVAAPGIGRALASSRLARVAAGGAIGAGAGALLGDGPDDAVLGGIAGVGLIAVPESVRSLFPKAGGAAASRAVQKLGEGLSYLSFKPLAEDQRLTQAFHKGMLAHLQSDPERLATYEATAGSSGVIKALSELHGVDDETSAAMMGFVAASAAFDHTAKIQSQAFGGSMDAYHTFRNKLINQVRMMPVPEAIDDYTPAMLDEIGWAAATTLASDRKGVIKEFRRLRSDLDLDPGKAFEMAAGHNERAVDTMRQLMSAENMPDFDTNMIGHYGGLNDVERSSVLEAYIPQIADTFGNFPIYSGVTSELRELNGSGILDGMVFAGAKNRFGRNVIPVRGDVIAGATPVSPGVYESRRSIMDILVGGDRVDVDKARSMGRFTPLARSTDVGRPTVMLQDTLDKQQLLEIADQWQDVLDAHKHLQGLPKDLKTYTLDHAAAIGLDANGNLGEWGQGQIKNLVESIGRDKKKWKYVLDFARRKGLSLDDVATEVARSADEIVNDSDLLDRIGLKNFARGDDGRALTGISALEQQTKALHKATQFRAARIDVDQLRTYVGGKHAPEEAERLNTFLDGVERDGYKLVHGTEFLMPEDIMMGPMFKDVSARHLNAVTLGNFFRGKLPVEARALTDRRRRLALVEELSKAGLQDLHPDDERIGWAVEDLYKVLHEYQDNTANMLQDLHNQSFFERTQNRILSSFTPFTLEQLTSKQGRVQEAMRASGWSEEEATAIWRATAKFRATDFADVGLYGLEAKLRSSNQAAWALKTLSGSKHWENMGEDAGQLSKLWASGKGKRYAGAAIGATLGGYSADDDASFEERLGRIAMGAAGGAAVATVAPRVAGAAGVDRLARAAENSRYGYLADNLARLRDSMRFTLSPFFDISRYTEGLTLAQTAGPKRLANGERMVLPLNMSPSGLRRRLAKGFRELDGLEPTAATAAARGRYDQYLAEFSAAARGNFDPDVLDSTGQWFKQIGIMGFSPTDWMTTAFAEMRRQGIESKEAFEAAKHMYSYGTTGRSAAELSANFVFFPFSFQKKALTHIAQWMNDDLARSIMVHDALKTYEVLDERYDLDTFWREHVPMLQQLNKLNLFAYGISPGRFGGINRQIIESGGKVAWNLFVPAGMRIKDASTADELKDVMHSLTPALNDINWMMEETREQGHVLLSQSHVTTQAEASQGYDAWSQFKEQFNTQLESSGFKFSDLQKPWAADAKTYYDAKKAELAARYPAWQARKVETMQNIDALNAEKELRLNRVALAAQTGVAPPVDDEMMFAMDGFIDQQKADLDLVGVTDPEDYPPMVNNAVLEKAVSYVQSNPGFRSLWKKFYEKTWGPISVPQIPGYFTGE